MRKTLKANIGFGPNFYLFQLILNKYLQQSRFPASVKRSSNIRQVLGNFRDYNFWSLTMID